MTPRKRKAGLFGLFAGLALALTVVFLPHQPNPEAPLVANPGTATRLPAARKPRNPEMSTEPTAELRATIVGVVKNQEGRPLSDAAVSVFFVEQMLRMTDLSHCSVTSKPDGAFSLTVPKPDTDYTLKCEADGYRMGAIRQNGGDAITQVHVPKEGVNDIEITMTRTGMISGHVVDQQRHPLSDVYLDVLRTGSDWRAHLEKGTRKDGEFVVSGLEAGKYAFWGRYSPLSKRYEWERFTVLGDEKNPLKEVTLTAGEWKENVEIIVPLDPKRFIEGVVVNESDEKLSNAEVWAVLPGGGGVGVMPKKTREDGAFKVGGILPAHPLHPDEELTQVSLHAQCEGYEPAVMDEVAVGSRGVKLTMMRERRGKIAIHLVDAESGDTIRDANVALWFTDTEWGEARKNKDFYEQSERKSGASLGWSGWFTIDNVPAGQAQVMILAPGYGYRQEMGIPVKSNETTEREITLEKAGVICVHATGRPDKRWQIPRFECKCCPEGLADKRMSVIRPIKLGAPSDIPCAIEGEEGRFHAHFTVSPGNYEILARSMLLSPESTTESIIGLEDVRSIPVQVEAGGLTDVPVDILLSEQSGTVRVIRSDQEQPVTRVCLLPGRRAPEELLMLRNEKYVDEPGYKFGRIFPKEICFIAPGEYTAVCQRVDDPAADPLVREITVRAGQTTVINFGEE